MLIKFKVNNKEYQVDSGITLIQACANVGIEIPRFCYHEKLSIAGNCRMCLVEISKPKSIKPAASCALPVINDMQIYTNTIMVKKARESVLEFLLINHPLDCPICDQGGECDLQDQTIIFGNDRGRFYDNKRAVADKECGPLIKTVMTRCIHCTRCVRFGKEVAGVDFLGTTGRGSHTEISQYINKLIGSELSGNIIDLCPVGALTSKSYAYMARSWELNSVSTIDVLDSLGSNIRIDVRGLDVLRILPRLNESINEEWLSDKSRFSYDAFNISRLHYPLIRLNKKFIPVSWEAAFSWISFQIFDRNISKTIGVIGSLVDSESILALKYFLAKLGKTIYQVENIYKLSVDFRSQYLLNLSILDLEKVSIAILVNLNSRLELPLLNTRLRKAVKLLNTRIYTYGCNNDLTYNFKNITNSVYNFLNFLEGKSLVCRQFLRSNSPIILMGDNVLSRFDSNCLNLSTVNVLKLIFKLNYKKSFFNIVAKNVGFVNACELGFSSVTSFDFKQNTKGTLLYMLGVSTYNYTSLKNSMFKIYQGHTGNSVATKSDIILPGTTFIESTNLFLNLEGRLQKTNFVKSPPGIARIDWKIINSLSLYLGYPLGFNNLKNIRFFLSVFSPNYKVGKSLCYLKNSFEINFLNFKVGNNLYLLYNFSYLSNFFDFYLNNPLSSVSRNMSRASKRFISDINFKNL